MIRAALFLIASVPVWLSCMIMAATEGEPPPGRNASRADRPPRKVIVGSVIFGPYGKYPGLKERLDELSGLVDEMAARAAKQYPGRGLDLAILPESAATTTSGPAHARAVPLEGEVGDTLGALARKHKSYILLPLDLAEEGPRGLSASNAAVLFDRRGKVAGIYRKRHPVAYVGSDELEAGITPGRDVPVFNCDFGKLGVQICWDIQFDDGWDALGRGGAEIVAWPSASPATALPAARAQRHRYYVVSSTWRDNATIFEPTGMVAAQALPPEKILVHQLDLSHAILGWSSFLRDGEALRAKYGERVGFHYSTREDMGLFWSNDPSTTIGTMIRSIGGEELDRQVERNGRLHTAARGGETASGLKITLRKPRDQVETVAREGGEIVTVTSASGIGGAVLERTGTAWPEPLRVRLRLRGLESLKVSRGPETILARGSHAGKSPTWVVVFQDSQKVEGGRLLDKQSRFWMDIQAIDDQGQPSKAIPLQRGHFEFTLPRPLLDASSRTISIEWIDFHR
jgi:predicted amidohydrolase